MEENLGLLVCINKAFIEAIGDGVRQKELKFENMMQDESDIDYHSIWASKHFLD